jgi:hypothetical protein
MSRTSEKERKEQRRDAFKLNLLPEHLQGVGHVAIRSAMLDKLIEKTAEHIMKRYPAVVQKHLEELTTPARLALVKDDLISALPEYRYAISEFTSEISSARHERNDIIHGLWRSTDAPEIKAIVDVGDTGDKEKRRVTAQSMTRLANQMLDLSLELADWKMCVNQSQLARSAASPGMPPPRILLPNPPRRSEKDHPRTGPRPFHQRGS